VKGGRGKFDWYKDVATPMIYTQALNRPRGQESRRYTRRGTIRFIRIRIQRPDHITNRQGTDKQYLPGTSVVVLHGTENRQAVYPDPHIYTVVRRQECGVREHAATTRARGVRLPCGVRPDDLLHPRHRRPRPGCGGGRRGGGGGRLRRRTALPGTGVLALSLGLIMADCHRRIMLDFALTSAYLRKRNLAKLDRLGLLVCATEPPSY